MRFTQGYWVIRQDYVMSYATQTVRVIKNDKELHIISACRPIRHRGDILDGRLTRHCVHRAAQEHHPRAGDALCRNAAQGSSVYDV